jgi:hypothetical protein
VQHRPVIGITERAEQRGFRLGRIFEQRQRLVGVACQHGMIVPPHFSGTVAYRHAITLPPDGSGGATQSHFDPA